MATNTFEDIVKEEVLTKVDNLDDQTVNDLLNEIDNESNPDIKIETNDNDDSQCLQSPMDIFRNNLPQTDTNESKQPDYDDNKSYELPEDIQQIFETGLDAIICAGELITKYINDTAGKSQSIITKMSKQDFATQFDKRTENLI